MTTINEFSTGPESATPTAGVYELDPFREDEYRKWRADELRHQTGDEFSADVRFEDEVDLTYFHIAGPPGTAKKFYDGLKRLLDSLGRRVSVQYVNEEDRSAIVKPFEEKDEPAATGGAA